MKRIAPPPAGKLYHGFYYSTTNGREHDVQPPDVSWYESTVGKQVAWVYTSDNWFESRAFPVSRCRWVTRLGKVPYLRLMLRSNENQNRPEPLYNVPAITAGKFDADLKQWARDAKAFGAPLIVEWGTECNGKWFSWNGWWNGRGQTDGFGDPTKPDGPERFVAAYRHIVDLMRGQGALNITWVWHIDRSDVPEVAWNRFENYYPGDGYVDWIGVSVYGPQSPIDRWDHAPFARQFDPAYQRLNVLAPSKPVLVPEFGCALHNEWVAADQWADGALRSLLSLRWPRVMGFCWWNETWENDNNPAHNTDMVIMHDPALSNVWNTDLAKHGSRVQELPVFAGG